MEEDVKDRIKKIREIIRYSQKDMANLLDIPVTTISKYERGENKPSLDILARIGKMLNVNLNWLLSGKGDIFISEKDKLNKIDFYERMAILERVEKIVEYVEVVVIKHKIILTPNKKADLIRHLIEHEESDFEPMEINVKEFEHLPRLESKVLDLCYMIEDQFKFVREEINSEYQKE